MLRTAIALVVGAAVWLPSMHRFYEVRDRERIVASLEERALSERTDVDVMRAVNPEWDYMSRTFTVLGLANRALAREAEKTRALEAIDRLVDRTLEEARDEHRFLLPYSRERAFVDPAARSVFVDGELLMMIAARLAIAPRPDYASEANELAVSIEGAMRRSPTLSAESYPDECWTFCNTTALAALAMLGRHDLGRAWVAYAKEHLVDPRTGLLVSSFTRDGRVLDGAEGSSIWMSATNLLLVDEAFAKEQYARARRELGVRALGFGWAREWPRGETARPDVDSGPIVPLLDASAGSSGFALLGASAFGDDAYEDALLASLELAGVPRDGRFLASNRVGDAVLFDALSFGPLWRKNR